MPHTEKQLDRYCRSLEEELVQVDAERRAAVQQANKLTLLSKSQTAILRTSFNVKIKARDAMVEDLLERLQDAQVDPADMDEVTERWRKICKLNAGITQDGEAAEGMVAEMEDLRSQNKRLETEIQRLQQQQLPMPPPPAAPSSSNSGQSLSQVNNNIVVDDGEEVKRLKARVEALQKDLEAAKDRAPATQQQQQGSKVAGEVEERMAALEAANRKAVKEAEDARKTLAAAEAEKSQREAAMQTEVANERAKCKALEADITRAKALVEKGDEKGVKEVEELREAKARATQAADAAKQEVKAMEEAAAQVKKALEERESQLRRVEKEKKELMDGAAKELNDVEARYKSEVSRLRKLAKAADSQRRSMVSVQKGARALASECQALRALVVGGMKDAGAEVVRDVKTAITRVESEQAKEMAQLRTQYRNELAERKKLFNLVQELRGNIRVFCRCRPPTGRELAMTGGEDNQVVVSFPNEGEVSVINDKRKEKTWEFDRTFGFESTQEAVYAEVSPLVTSALDGYNVCIFAYGQTGTGKTFTMNGPPSNRGVNMRALEDLFTRSSARRSEIVDELSVSILEIYNENIRDLLAEDANSSKKLEIRQGPNGMYVTDLMVVPVNNMGDVTSLMELGDRHRSMASTSMNEHSSRSHLLVSVYIQSRNVITNAVSRGKLHMVDLAGSERISKSGATGQALKEAQNINKSLSALGDVISALVAKQGHVPYRNSTLTYLLQDSLGGDSKTLMFVCVSPVLYNAEETFCSLNFASRVRTVELGKATKHVVSQAPPAMSPSSASAGGGGGGSDTTPSGSRPRIVTSSSSPHPLKR